MDSESEEGKDYIENIIENALLGLVLKYLKGKEKKRKLWDELQYHLMRLDKM